ncbi:hypothetical protein [Pollutibacter soli]|uniref:hypothetical protein n=1 Tax=Pollutibacter soli TaxID=3034157 RepID=UPI0030135FDC
MKPFFILCIIFCGYLVFASCKKESLNTDAGARISFSADTLFFDTVFTRTGSITHQVKIFNANQGRLHLDEIRIGGGSSSPFMMNADGTEGIIVNDLDIASGDSLYVFVTVTIDPNSDQLPFIVTDSLLIAYNGREEKIQLQAFGQNANFLRSNLLQGSHIWNNELPYVILGGIQIDTGAMLTIEKGTRVYLHADAPFIVDGTLKINGTKTDSVVFAGDRLDKEYRDLPAGWPGIYFRGTSKNNQITYAILKNGYQGVVTDQPSPNAEPKLRIHETVIDNMYEAALTGLNSSFEAINCRITNSGINILILKGGNYDIKHCTAASYSNLFITHKNPVLYINNWDSVGGTVYSYNLLARLTNNIFWSDDGIVENEVVVSKRGSNSFDVTFENNLYRANVDPENSFLINNLKNLDPLFDSVNASARYYDFHIGKFPSPAIDYGVPAGVLIDLDGKTRGATPSIGCYEPN